MKKITVMSKWMLFTIFLVCLASCQEKDSVISETETQTELLNEYAEILHNVSKYVNLLPAEDQQSLRLKCQTYLSADNNEKEALQSDIWSLLKLGKTDFIKMSTLNGTTLYERFSSAYSITDNENNTATRGTDCEAKRDAALKDLALKYEIELAAACLVATLSAGIVTAVAVATLTAITEIDRQAIHREYEECIKG